MEANELHARTRLSGSRAQSGSNTLAGHPNKGWILFPDGRHLLRAGALFDWFQTLQLVS
jgi:hypothetical protein